MKIEVLITEADLRRVVRERLKEKSGALLESHIDFQVKTTCRSNETWRRPTYLKAVVIKETDL